MGSDEFKKAGESFRSSARQLSRIDSSKRSFRDDAALAALQGLLSQSTSGLVSHLRDFDKSISTLGDMTIAEAYAWMAYRFADAMLEERKKKGDQK